MKKTRKLKRVLSFGMAAVMAVGLTGVASAAGVTATVGVGADGFTLAARFAFMLGMTW